MVLALIGFFYLASGYVVQSEEEDNRYAPDYEVILREGKQLTLADYTNKKLYFPLWYYEGRLLTDSRCRVTHVNLVCPSVSLNDAGLYELVATDRNDRRYLVMSAKVHVTRDVAEPRVFEPVSRFVEEVERVPARERYHDDCFCSGITGRCRMADDLYRSVHNFNLSSAEPIERVLSPTDATPERCVAIPGSVWGGNLITSYGGYLRFPVTNECYMERTKPCVVLTNKHGLAIGHYLSPRHDTRQLSVLMNESSWKLLNAPEAAETEPNTNDAPTVDKFTFMSVLAHIHMVYIRGRYRSQQEDTVLSIDQASAYDEGLGRVSTVEECLCHRGYAGLSCERCEKGYARNDETISSNGVCISLSDLWRSIKRKYNVD